jgi:uncharacterized protein (TIGR02453 family)
VTSTGQTLSLKRMFEGFGPEAMAWFAGLERDNSRDYFHATRPTYEEQVREPLEDLLDELAGEIGGEVKVFRQHRDIRFSKDKSPYKTRTYGVIRSGGALYAEISARGLFAASGYWRMAAEQLERYRAAVDDDGAGDALAAAVASSPLEVFEPELKVAPRGFPRDHPRVELLRHKSLIAGSRLAPGPELQTRAALDHVAGTWRRARPITAWLDEHVG